MTIDAKSIQRTPRIRFLASLQRWIRVWAICILLALGLTIVGIFPTAISIVAVLGVVWIPIVTLTLWGRMLDEMMRPHSDIEDGCR